MAYVLSGVLVILVVLFGGLVWLSVALMKKEM